MDHARRILADATPRTLALPERGLEVALLDWGGAGPLALLHHANGFCKGMWGLVAEPLREHFRVVAMDARGHGDTRAPSGAAFEWEFAGDVAAVAERLGAEHGGRVALGLGHSFGGTSLLGAAQDRPDLFERLVLVDPVVPPPAASAPPERSEHLENLIGGALKRRAEWPSRAEARAWWAERDFFTSWLPDALDLYVLDGLREREDGDVELKCRGEVEAAVFRNGGNVDVAAWARAVRLPCLWLWASRGNFPRFLYEAIVADMASARIETVDAGHLVPMERPDLVVDAVLRFQAEG